MNKSGKLAAASLAVALLSACSSPDYASYASSYVRQFDATHAFVPRAVARPDGLKISAREFGAANRNNGPTIVLMHGFPDSQHLYDAVVPQLAKTRHVITFDFVGWGDSDKPVHHRYDVASLRQDLEAVVAAYDLKSVVLVVHDLSGQPGIDWALDNESRVSALVLLNTYYLPMPVLEAPEATARFSTPGLLRDLSVWGANRSDAQWEKGVVQQTAKFFSSAAARETYSSVFAYQALGIRPAFFGENAVLQDEVARRAAMEPRLKAFGQPVDIVFGADDRYLNPGVAQEFHRLFPHSELHLISHAAHYVQLDEPAEVVNRILVAGASQVQPAAGQGLQVLGQHQADVSFTNYRFRDGETLPELRIHYTTLGAPHKNPSGAVDNAILLLHWTNASSQALLTPEFKQALFAPGAPLDASRYFVVIPDDIGHGQSSKPSDGLKAAFPHYGYGDMVDLQHKLVVEALGIAHLRAVVGMSMGCMNAWQWSEDYPDSMDGIMPIACFPAPISGRNLLWRRILIHSVESDPSGRTAFAIARMMIDGVPNLQQEVSSPQAADALLRGIEAQTAGQDTNNVLYSFESSADFNAEPGLSRIKTKVYALNFADDEFYRDSLQVLQTDMRRVHQGRVVIRATSAGSAGHFTMSHPALWRDQVELFMKWLGTSVYAKSPGE